jgi:dipeptidyl aminopeptidase/acylaminoacyl peptidase
MNHDVPLKFGRQSRRFCWIRSKIHVRSSTQVSCPFVIHFPFSERLKGNWGIVDVKDCIDAFTILASDPYSLIDKNRVAIRGGSAGGFTTLAALSIAPNTKRFKAACSYYGISDLLTFGQTTHKYELRYVEKLLGATADQDPDLYKARSAVYHAENISVPLLVMLRCRRPLMFCLP